MEVFQMKIENVSISNFNNAIRGMRNPLDSWAKSDSKIYFDTITLGPNDLDLAMRLIKGGTEHRKFLRQIFVSMDITAPLYWWKEMDTYKIGTTANSCSTMHTITKSPITITNFDLGDVDFDILEEYDSSTLAPELFVKFLEWCRTRYIETKDTRYWKELIRWLPESWLQKRTWTADYEVLMNIYRQRHNHKLNEWHIFCNNIITLPYMKEFLEL